MAPTKKRKDTKSKTQKRQNKKDTMLFFDDDYNRNIKPFRDMFPKIKSIYVPPDKPYKQILNDKPDFYYPILFSKKYKDNQYAQQIAKGMDINHSANLCNQCSLRTSQGITISQTKGIIKWANESSLKKERCVLFDLDNTLSICPLIMIPRYTTQCQEGKFIVEEIAQYISGTAERYDALLLMFFHLRKNGVACKIFTNNSWADKMNKTGFEFLLKIMQAFDPRMKEEDIIYGHYDKVATFKNSKEFMRMYNNH